MKYTFGSCVFDTDSHTLRRDGRDIPLEPQVYDMLSLFLREAGKLVDRDRLIEEVWGGRIVSDATISSRINALRKAIGDNGKVQALLRTVPRRGFRLVVGTETRGGIVPPMPDAFHMQIATSVDGTSIAFATEGSGPPLMRAGHFLTHLELDRRSPIWQPTLGRLGAEFTLTRYDQRGTGMSEAAPPSMELDDFVADLRAVADAAGLSRFAIFAACQAVPASIAFAARYPERVSCLVLYGGYAQGRSLRGHEHLVTRDALRTFIAQGWGRGGSAFLAGFVTTYAPDATREQIEHFVELQRASATVENALALRDAVDAFDVRDLLGDIKAPTLIVHARRDSVHPLSQAGILAAGIPNARLQVLESRNHVYLPGDPSWESLMQATERFVKEYQD